MAKKKNPRKSRPIRSKKARVQKKQITRASEDRLRKAGLSSTQIKNLPTYVRTDPEKVEKFARTKELIDFGISPSMISRADLASKDLTRKTMADWKTRGQKLDELTRLGITDFRAADLRLSWPKLMEKYPGIEPPTGYKIRGTSGNRKVPAFNPNIRLTGNNYLYIGAAEVQGGFHAEDLTGLSDDDLIDRINERVSDATGNPDSSSDLFCVFQVHYGSRSDCEELAKFYYGRGYNMTAGHMKTIKDRYQRVTVSNSFSQREFHEMVYTCISQMKNEDVGPFISQMKGYCRSNGFPFMKGIK